MTQKSTSITYIEQLKNTYQITTVATSTFKNMDFYRFYPSSYEEGE